MELEGWDPIIPVRVYVAYLQQFLLVCLGLLWLTVHIPHFMYVL